MVQGPNDRELIRNLRLERHVLTNLDTGNVGTNRAEWSAILARCIGLHVVRFELARPSPHPEQDDRRVRTRSSGPSTPPKQIREYDSPERKRTHAQELTPRNRTRADGCRHSHNSS